MRCLLGSFAIPFYKIPEPALPTADRPVQCKQPNQSERAFDDELGEATIAEGDEHRRQISGAPQASMMCVEYPESFSQTVCCPAL